MEAIMDEINNGIKDAAPDYEQEVFLGFESGAIGLFKLELDENRDFKIVCTTLIAPQRVVTEMKTKHVLTLLPFEAKKVDPMVGAQEFKLAVGYFSKYI